MASTVTKYQFRQGNQLVVHVIMIEETGIASATEQWQVPNMPPIMTVASIHTVVDAGTAQPRIGTAAGFTGLTGLDQIETHYTAASAAAIVEETPGAVMVAPGPPTSVEGTVLYGVTGASSAGANARTRLIVVEGLASLGGGTTAGATGVTLAEVQAEILESLTQYQIGIGDGTTTAFTLPSAPLSNVSLHVEVGAVPQRNPSITGGTNDVYTVSGTTLTFTSAPPVGATVVVWGIFS